MTDDRAFRTLRGFLAGDEPDIEPYFAYGATLRVFGDLDLDGITSSLELVPTYMHRQGERKGPKSPPYKQDMWQFSPQLAEELPLEKHIDALWQAIKPKRHFLLALRQSATVDVFLGYRSNSDTAGFEIPYQQLELFTQLQIPLGVSIVIA